MAFSVTTRNACLDTAGAQGSWISLHTADPGATGTSEAAGVTRVQTTWSAAASGSKSGTQVTISVPAGTYSYYGVWSAVTAGTFSYGNQIPGGPITYGSAGTMQVAPTITD